MNALDLTLLFNKHHYGDEQVRMAADLVNRMLRWVPSDRLSAIECMNHPFLKETPLM